MLIGELAETLDVSAKTLRHYEKIGLVPRSRRLANGYRLYDEAAIARLRLVVSLRRLDLSLEAVRELLEGDGDGRNLRQRLMGRIDQQIQECDLGIAVLQGRREDLQARYDALVSAAARPPHCICGALLEPCTCGER